MSTGGWNSGSPLKTGSVDSLRKGVVALDGLRTGVATTGGLRNGVMTAGGPLGSGEIGIWVVHDPAGGAAPWSPYPVSMGSLAIPSLAAVAAAAAARVRNGS